MRLSLYLLAALAFVFTVSLGGCDTVEEQRDFTEEAFGEQPSGFTRTDEDGNVDSTEVDPDDWRTAPSFSGVNVSPVYPNPIESGFARLDVLVPFGSVQGQLLVCAFISDRFEEIDRFQQADGAFTFVLGTAQFGVSDELVRLFLMEAPGGSCGTARRVVSYGDLYIE